jgi:Family of unknown function (DUF5670)
LNPLPQKDFGGIRKELNMLWTIFVILLVLWLLGFIGGYTGGGLIHIVLVIAAIVLVVRLIQGRKIL